MSEPETPELTSDGKGTLPYGAPPSIGEREWFIALFERFGFLLIAGCTFVALGFLLLNADLLLRKPATNGQLISATPVSMRADSLQGAQLSISSRPAGAVIFVDEDSVGIAPIDGYALLPGVYDLSVRRGTQRKDTLLMLRSGEVSLSFDFEPIPSALAEKSGSALGKEAATVGPAPRLQDEEPAAQPPTESNTAPEEAEREPASKPGEATALPAVDNQQEASGRLVVVSQPAGAEVVLDGEVLGTTPFEQPDMATGTYTLTLRHEGFQDFNTELLVEDDQTTRLDGLLTALQGTLKVLVRPWGAITIDDTLHKEETNIWYSVELAAGDHRLRVEHPSLGRWEQVVLVPPDSVKEVVVDFNK